MLEESLSSLPKTVGLEIQPGMIFDENFTSIKSVATSVQCFSLAQSPAIVHR
jgi:hypothetical protein